MGKKTTYPNQNIIKIKKTPCKTNFLQISNDEVAAAAVDLGKNFNAFKLYLYLAGNEINYEKALSMVDFSAKYNVAKSSYYDNIKLLIEKGYLVSTGAHSYDFYTTPQLSARMENSSAMENSTVADKKSVSIAMENSAPVENIIEMFNF